MTRQRSRIMAAQSAALDYVRRGWSVVPVPYRTKRPILDKWEQLRIIEEELPTYFSAWRQNVGVLLGEPSHWLIDVDLDHELAIAAAGKYLPTTASIFGRNSKRRSHWLFYASEPVDTRQFRLPDRKMVVELRSTGGQTVFPGSVHASGERVEWELEGEPAKVDPNELSDCLQTIFDEVCMRLKLPLRKPQHSQFSDRNAPHYILERARKYLAKLPPAISNQGGHNATFHAACILVGGFGLDRGDALSLLREWNETCQPPWSERELEHKVADALTQEGWRGYLLNRSPRSVSKPVTSAIDRANRHAIEHRRRARRRPHT